MGLEGGWLLGWGGLEVWGELGSVLGCLVGFGFVLFSGYVRVVGCRRVEMGDGGDEFGCGDSMLGFFDVRCCGFFFKVWSVGVLVRGWLEWCVWVRGSLVGLCGVGGGVEGG